MISYSKRAVADLRNISAESVHVFGEQAAQELGAHIQAVIDHIHNDPYIGHEISQKPETYTFPLASYPFKIFYRIFRGGVRIQHIRHTARREWEGE